MDICINGRFLAGPPAATYAVAERLSRALVALGASGAYPADWRMRVLAPPNACALDAGLPVERVGSRTGNLWEQIDLPRAAGGRLLINFAARSPLLLRNGLTMVHDAQVFTAPSSYSLAFRATLKANIRLAGRRQLGLLTVSDFAKSELVGLGLAPAERVHVIPNGVDHALRAPPQTEILARFGLAPRGYALALANLMPHKNIPLLIRAFARPALAGMTLVLVGGTGRAAFAAAGVTAGANVVFPGYVNDGEMRALQENALAVCTPSLTEGFGLPPVEGLMLGTPAVIAPCGALPEVCGPGALQADPHDPSAWEAALLRLRDESGLRARLARDGRAFVARFTWHAAGRRLLEVVDTVAASRGRCPP
ncbi:glycosyltransferase involved in cell wall biosynthesis [Ancylobacter polymorphus]|uniref:Glycosyltransferase involved in cell wall biosynthesis n=1 Tax=Ancylobacter polymorphus TaxID=223390 RepID=A0ABU0BHA6_9HYPH|nr:glycosyltransferase family 1 protein [Ancylobacter polymorphus]MDQ0304706.1 glycosyltransferase involved in cell wall biosynthesis [Ancylobacter polymorphus]